MNVLEPDTALATTISATLARKKWQALFEYCCEPDSKTSNEFLRSGGVAIRLGLPMYDLSSILSCSSVARNAPCPSRQPVTPLCFSASMLQRIQKHGGRSRGRLMMERAGRRNGPFSSLFDGCCAYELTRMKGDPFMKPWRVITNDARIARGARRRRRW